MIHRTIDWAKERAEIGDDIIDLLFSLRTFRPRWYQFRLQWEIRRWLRETYRLYPHLRAPSGQVPPG